jgi:hypothetical protein
MSRENLDEDSRHDSQNTGIPKVAPQNRTFYRNALDIDWKFALDLGKDAQVTDPLDRVYAMMDLRKSRAQIPSLESTRRNEESIRDREREIHEGHVSDRLMVLTPVFRQNPP